MVLLQQQQRLLLFRVFFSLHNTTAAAAATKIDAVFPADTKLTWLREEKHNTCNIVIGKQTWNKLLQYVYVIITLFLFGNRRQEKINKYSPQLQKLEAFCTEQS